MARIQYSALVDNIRGSIGGTTFQSNSYGFTVKKKPNMVKPYTPDQNKSKAILSKVTRSWRALSSAERTAYNTFASTYPQYAKHNPTAELSGYAVFVKYNFLRVLAGSSILETFSGAPPAEDTLSYIVDVTSNVLRIYIDSTNNSELWTIIFFLSRSFNDSQNFIGTKPKYVDHDVNFDGNTDITTVYTNKFGALPIVGDKIALDTVLISDDVPYVLARTSDFETVVTGT